ERSGSINESTKRTLEAQVTIGKKMSQAKRGSWKPLFKKAKITHKAINDDRPLIQRWNLLVILPKKKAAFSLRDPDIIKLMDFLKEDASEININRKRLERSLSFSFLREVSYGAWNNSSSMSWSLSSPSLLLLLSVLCTDFSTNLDSWYVTVSCRSEAEANIIKDELNNFEMEGEKIILSDVNRAVVATRTQLYPLYFVYFETPEEAQRVLEAQPYCINGQTLVLNNPKLVKKNGSEETEDEDLAKGDKVCSENIAQTAEDEEASMQPTVHSDDSDEELEDNQAVELSTVKNDDIHEVHFCLPKSKKSLKNPDILRLLTILEKAADIKIHREFHVLCPTEDVAQNIKIAIENFVVHGENIKVISKYKSYREPVVDPNLHIGGLPAGTTTEDVTKLFPAAERVEQRSPGNNDRNINNESCFVYFNNESDVKNAIQSKPFYIDGKEVCVDEAVPHIKKRPRPKFQKRKFKRPMTIMISTRATSSTTAKISIKTPIATIVMSRNQQQVTKHHLADMNNLLHTTELEKKHPDVVREFNAGNFTVQKTRKVFSSISIDQAQEQNNACIKGDGGAVGLTNNPSALRCWMASGPEVARVVEEFKGEHRYWSRQRDTHHSRCANPFEEESLNLVALHTKEIASPSAAETVRNAKSIGQDQFQTFTRERLMEGTKPADAILHRSKLKVFRAAGLSQARCELFSWLYIGCETRDGNLEEFFRHEDQACPPALSDGSSICRCMKSDLLACLGDLTVAQTEAPPATRMHQEDELRLAFCTGKSFHYLAAHEMAACLGPEKVWALPMFHALTGCDTVSSFSDYLGKWAVYPDLTEALLKLSAASKVIPEDVMHIIERFVILLYDRTSSCMDINKARRKLFTKKNNVQLIPPRKAALEEHLPLPTSWGWTKNAEGLYTPFWTTLPGAAHTCYELVSCRCKKGCVKGKFVKSNTLLLAKKIPLSSKMGKKVVKSNVL
ncbi:putative RNA recognition motif-containing protein 2, partial [Homarus americanus]